MNVDCAALERFGYSRGLWVAAPGRWYLRLGGLSVCSEEEAIAEVSELVVGEEEDA
jgi:hypothetical protein